MKESTKKKAAYAGAGVTAAGGLALLLRKKGKIAGNIGTPLSNSKVIHHSPGKTRTPVGRVVGMAERLDERLKEFISTEELPWGSGLCGPSDKPNYPSLWLSRSTDPGLMKLPGEGSAMVRYKVKRREIDESREDGQPLYGASIEIQSLEPVAEAEEEEGEELESTLFLREFGSGGERRLLRKIVAVDKIEKKMLRGHLRNGIITPAELIAKRGARTQGLKNRLWRKSEDGYNRAAGKKVSRQNRGGVMRVPEGVMDFEEVREFGSAGYQKIKRAQNSIIKKMKKTGAQTDQINRAMKPLWAKDAAKFDRSFPKAVARDVAGDLPEKAYYPLGKRVAGNSNASLAGRRSFSSTLFLRHFAEARDRDGEGRFAAGNVPGPQDYALAGMMARNKKKVAAAAGGVGVLAGGAALARTERGRQLFKQAGESATRAAGRMIR